MGKRLAYFASSIFRIISSIGLLIAYIVVRITVSPAIDWLNTLLLVLTISTFVTAVFNFILCGLTANAYKSRKLLQIFCFIITAVTGGFISSTFTGIAAFTSIPQEEIDNENIFKVRK